MRDGRHLGNHAPLGRKRLGDAYGLRDGAESERHRERLRFGFEQVVDELLRGGLTLVVHPVALRDRDGVLVDDGAFLRIDGDDAERLVLRSAVSFDDGVLVLYGRGEIGGTLLAHEGVDPDAAEAVVRDRLLHVREIAEQRRLPEIFDREPFGLASVRVNRGDHGEEATVGVDVGVAPLERAPLGVSVTRPARRLRADLRDVAPSERLRIAQRPRHRFPHGDAKRNVDQRFELFEQHLGMKTLPTVVGDANPGLVTRRPEVRLRASFFDLVPAVAAVHVLRFDHDAFAADLDARLVELLDRLVDERLLGVRGREDELNGVGRNGRDARRVRSRARRRRLVGAGRVAAAARKGEGAYAEEDHDHGHGEHAIEVHERGHRRTKRRRLRSHIAPRAQSSDTSEPKVNRLELGERVEAERA